MTMARILIVDDEAQTRQTLWEYFTARIECQILQAANGYEALAILEQGNIDVVLTDIKMPGISGREVIEKAKAISPDIAVIVLTKWDSSELSAMMHRFGIEYIPKPFSLKVVYAKVQQRLTALGKFSAKTID